MFLVVLLQIFQPALGQSPAESLGNTMDFSAPPCPSQNSECANKLNILTDDNSWFRTEEEEINQHHEEGVHPDEAENTRQVLSCVFNSVPIIGGEWLADLARLGFSDEELLEGAHTFVAGGKIVAQFVDVRGSHHATKLIRFLESCLQIEEHPDDIQRSEVYDSVIDSEEILQLRGSTVRQSSSTLSHRRKKRSVSNSGGYGTDSLVGFNLLGLLVVGALITYLVYLLTM